MTEQKKSGSGCLKAAGIGCGAVLVLSIILGVVAVKTSGRWLPALMGKGTVAVADAMFDEFKIPPAEKAAAMAPIRELGDKISSGQVTLEQGGKIIETISEGVLPSFLMLRMFELSYLAPSSLPAGEKQKGSVTLSRFAQGFATGVIDKSAAEPVSAIVTEKKTGAGGKETTKLKSTITTEELQQCLQIMKDAADKAGIEEREFKIDLAGEIRKAIEKGLAQVPAAPGVPEVEKQ